MSLTERIEQVGGEIISATIAAVFAAGAWMVRRVLTSQKVADAALEQVRMLRQEIERRDKDRQEQRREDREAVEKAVDSLRVDVKDLGKEIAVLFRRQE